MSAESDQAWLDALAGRPHSGEARAARLEGELLREALRVSRAAGARESASVSQPALPDPERERTLLLRAQREGLVDAPAGPSTAAVAKRAARPVGRWIPLLAGAALAGIAIGITWQLRAPDEVATVRDAAEEIVRLEAPDPAALKERLLAELRTAGVEARGYEALGVQGIDADLPQPLPPAVRRLLEAHGIEPPGGGVLIIEIRESR